MSQPLVVLHVVTVGSDGVNVSIGRSFEAAAVQFAATVPAEDAVGAFDVIVSVPRENAADWTRLMLGAYSRQHAERVIEGLDLA